MQAVGFSLPSDLFGTQGEVFLSTSSSESQWVMSSSIPEVSSEDDSFPSRSAFGNSSVRASVFILLFHLGCVGVSFSVRHRTCITDLVFFSKLGMLVTLVEPVMPVRVGSSAPAPMLSGFFTVWAAEHGLYSVDVFLTFSSQSIPDRLAASHSFSFSGNKKEASLPPVW